MTARRTADAIALVSALTVAGLLAGGCTEDRRPPTRTPTTTTTRDGSWLDRATTTAPRCGNGGPCPTTTTTETPPVTVLPATTTTPAPIAPGPVLGSCADATGPVYRGGPLYQPELDRDGDGVACEG